MSPAGTRLPRFKGLSRGLLILPEQNLRKHFEYKIRD